MAKQVYTTGQILTAAQMTTLQANDYNQTVSAKVASYTLVSADAGTRITMSNAGATTITVNTAIFAAGDTLEITNIGVGICTVTAGTATVSTSSTLALKQFDTGQLYFTSTGVAIFFMADAADAGGSPLTTKGDLYTFSTVDARLAVGTNGQVLTCDSTEATGLKYATPASGTTFSGVLALKTADQTISNSTFTILSFPTETNGYDTDSYHDNSVNNSRLTIPSGKTGYFWVWVNVTFAPNATGRRVCRIVKNGTVGFVMEATPTSAANQEPTIIGGKAFAASATDYFELDVFQNSGGNLDVYGGSVSNTQFGAYFLGA